MWRSVTDRPQRNPALGFSFGVDQMKDVGLTLSEIAMSYQKARLKYQPIRSPHEGYAILMEEVDELWEVVKASHIGAAFDYSANSQAMRKEALHVAAMALAFLVEVCE